MKHTLPEHVLKNMRHELAMFGDAALSSSIQVLVREGYSVHFANVHPDSQGLGKFSVHTTSGEGTGTVGSDGYANSLSMALDHALWGIELSGWESHEVTVSMMNRDWLQDEEARRREAAL